MRDIIYNGHHLSIFLILSDVCNNKDWIKLYVFLCLFCYVEGLFQNNVHCWSIYNVRK